MTTIVPPSCTLNEHDAPDVDERPTQLGGVRLGEALVVDREIRAGQPVTGSDVVERVGPPMRPVDQLVDHHELAGMDVGLQRTDRTRCDDGTDAERRHRPHVRPIRDAVCGVLVVAAVAGEEGDPPPSERADADRRRRCPERCRQLDVDRVVEELVEAGPAEHADLCAEAGGTVGEGDEHQLDVGAADFVGVVDPPDFVVDAVGLLRLLRRGLRLARLESSRLPRIPDFDSDVDSDFESELVESDFESASFLAPVSLADFLPRLSVLKNPLPLNVTPTGVNTFLTASTSPESGWANSVRVASVKACWTSIVSPVSTNLYT